MKVIPIDEIDKLIAEIEDTITHVDKRNYDELVGKYRVVLGFLEQIKQKTISAITIEKIDEKIKSLKEEKEGFLMGEHDKQIWWDDRIQELEDLKK